MKRIITLVAFLLCTVSAFSQAPQKMSYQAVVRNSSSELIPSAAVGMKISILQNTATGNAVYSETQNATTNENGLLSLEIGSGNPISGTFSSINWATGPYFIKTEIDPLGGTAYTITGTSQLMSVPYALFAASGNSGPQGIPGPAGPQGPAGEIGLTGAIGPQGLQGLVGPQGIQGLIGETGLTGAVGPQGLQGLIGETGLTGAIGPQGIQGLVGPQGIQGLIGETGLTGAVGPQGIQGLVGPQGLQGLVGPQGLQGLIGETGLTGAIGPQGIQGLVGPQGIQGLIGETGLTGAVGPQGIQGLVGPQGLQGLVGPQGIQGLVGETGLTGAVGPQGIQGLVGPTGLAGAIGPQGLQGLPGLGSGYNFLTKTADYTITVLDVTNNLVILNTSGTPHSFTLPSALLAGAGKTINVAGTTFQTINVKTNGIDKITGAFITTETINIFSTLGSYMAYTNLISDGVSKWYVVSAYY